MKDSLRIGARIFAVGATIGALHLFENVRIPNCDAQVSTNGRVVVLYQYCHGEDEYSGTQGILILGEENHLFVEFGRPKLSPLEFDE